MSARAVWNQPLTPEQCRLVEGNLGLVAVHLRRHGRSLSRPRRDRERDDLFQEGCLGLMQAAATYRPDSGIPFSTYALSRIHNAVSQALTTRFHTVQVPAQRVQGAQPAGDDPRPACEPSGPVTLRLGTGRMGNLPARPCAARPAAGQTVGTRLREKYERALRDGGRALLASARDKDGGAVIDRLIEERLLVASDEWRCPLRRIAREAASSYARVVSWERQLTTAAERALSADPEASALWRMARCHPGGMSAPLDEAVERRLAETGADAFVERVRKADPRRRVGLLTALAEVGGAALEASIRHQVCRMSPAARERLFRVIGTAEPVTPRRRARRRKHHPDGGERARPRRTRAGEGKR